MGQRNRWAGTGWSRVPPERALVGNRFCPCPEWNGSGGRGCERRLNGKKEPGAPSCSTPALRRPFPRFIFKPHHHLLSSGYDARLPDAQTEAQRSATAYLESRGPHSGGAAIWARNRGCVHGAWPNAGSEKCRQAEEGELAQGPPGGPPRRLAPRAHPRGCGGSRSAHQAQAGPQPAARSRQASPIDRAPRALDPDAGSGRRRPVRAEPRDGPACPPGLLLRRFEFPGARAAGRGGPQCPTRAECVRSCVLSVREMPHFKDDGKEKKVKHSRQSSLC